MLDLLEKDREPCGEFRDHLEAAAGTAPPATTVEELFSGLSAPLQNHGASCPECRVAAEELLSVRALLSALPAPAAVPDPWFAPRVMAAIAARETETSRAGSYWTAVPILAARLALASAALLLVVSTWIYERPLTAPAGTPSVDSAPESLFENSPPPANQDDILISLAERPR